MQNSNNKNFFMLFVVLFLVVGAIFYQSSLKKKSSENSNPNPQVVKAENLVLESPKAGDLLDGKVLIKGTAKGGWFFEGSFPVFIEDKAGNQIAVVPIQSKGEWMTADPVAFDQTIEFFTDQTEGFIVLKKDNPSDDRSLDEEVRIPVKFVPGEAMSVSAFFGNSIYNPNQIDCEKVYPVERKVKKDPKTATMALKELLKGPTVSETKEGYSTSLNYGIELNKISISNGEAKVDFNSVLGEGVAGSCRVGQIRAQIESTLKQFPTVTSVVISIDGVSEGILQP
jgi:hypothetical protein